MFETSVTRNLYLQEKTENPQEKDIKSSWKMYRVNTQFHREDNSKSNRCLKKCSLSIVIRETLIRTIMIWHLTLDGIWNIRKGKQ